MSPLEHVAFALHVPHPSEVPLPMDLELRDAIQFECAATAEAIDAWREVMLGRLVHLHASLQTEQDEWVQGAPVALQPCVASFHGPLWRMLLEECGVPADSFLQHLQQGFPLVGQLPPCECESRPHVFPDVASVRELRQARPWLNQEVLESVKELPYSADILSQTLADSAMHFMTLPRPLMPEDLQTKSFTRRIPVREERASGWRTRVVDHMTESGVNLCTQPVDKIRHDNLDTLSEIVLKYFEADCPVHLWKRDISQAYRRVPVAMTHWEFAWVVWLHEGVYMTAQHTGIPFGAVAAVYSFHRAGGFLCKILRKAFRCPAARYVDDFFGVSRAGVLYHAGKVLSVLSRFLGFPTDDAKDAQETVWMICLGAQVRVMFASKQLFTCVAPAKAAKYSELLEIMLTTGVLSPGEASKMAGRLGFSVCVSGNRVGRAFIKPFHAQAHLPLARHTISPQLRRAGEWFAEYLTHCPTSVRSFQTEGRPKVISWSDASGQGNWVAAVIFVSGQFFWTRTKTPDQVLAELLPRQDCQIQFQELLGLILTWHTFQSVLGTSLWLAFVDNNAVLHSVTKGSGCGPEAEYCIGRLWLELANRQVDLRVARVESCANISDGPSRDDLSQVAMLKATWVEPCLPEWLSSFWEGAPRVA